MFPALVRSPEFESRLVADHDASARSREEYQCIAAALHHLHDGGLSVVMVTSAMPREGKTVTAANLALTFSSSYRRRVLLVDADLRRPSLHALFGIENTVGLSSVLAAADERPLPARTVAPRLAIVPAGVPTADPAAGLTSPRLKRLIDGARSGYDWVVIDTPPVALLPDATLLASMVDGAVLVVRAGFTAYGLVNRAVDTIGRARIVGIVLNGVEPAPLADARYTRRNGSDNA